MKRIGTQIELTEDERAKLESDLRYWHRIVADPNSSIARRKEYENAFYCIWKGQNAKGVRLNHGSELAKPFEGASDQRLRWGEQIFKYQMALALVAISSCEVEIVCSNDEDQEKARALKALLNGVSESLGAKGLAEIKAMFHYMFCDTPAVGALDVYWKRRRTIGVITLYPQLLQEEYAAAMEMAGEARDEAAVRFRLACAGEGDVADAEDVASWLTAAKGVPAADAMKVIAALGEEFESEDGAVECRAVVAENEGPELKALRYGEDFCIPAVTNDFDYASPWFRSEWLTEAQLRERVGEDGWDAAWAEETLKFKGFDLFNEWATAQFEEMKDLVNVVWCYQAETNENGETTRYVSVISHASGSAFGKRILTTRRGRWDTAFFRREVINSNILTGRGIAELVSPAQGTAKIVRDMAANNAIVGSLPPVKAKGARVRNVLLAPSVVVPMGQSDDITYMQPPAFPAAADKQEEKIKAELYDYFGVPHDGMDMTDRRMEFTEWMIRQWRDFLVLLLETAQDNASDEFIARVTANGDVAGLKSADVSGGFTMTLKLDPRNLDNKMLIDKINAASQMLQSMDRKGTVDTDPFVRYAFSMLFPEVSARAMKNPAELMEDETKAEEQNFILIKAGIMPQMDTSGKWNYQTRLDFYTNLQQNNPAAIQDMSPTSQTMLFEQWIPALQQQLTQYGENAEIGKTGVMGVGAQ